MKREIDLVRQQHAKLGFPVRDTFDAQIPTTELLARRRALRQQTDELIEIGLYSNNRPALAAQLALTMTALAGTCVQIGYEPSLEDMVVASKELIEDARLVFDKGLHMREWEQARAGTAILEIVCHGIAALVGIPSAEVFDAVHEGLISGASVDAIDASIAELLNKEQHHA
jgi:hypothetical protein